VTALQQRPKRGSGEYLDALVLSCVATNYPFGGNAEQIGMTILYPRAVVQQALERLGAQGKLQRLTGKEEKTVWCNPGKAKLAWSEIERRECEGSLRRLGPNGIVRRRVRT